MHLLLRKGTGADVLQGLLESLGAVRRAGESRLLAVEPPELPAAMLLPDTMRSVPPNPARPMSPRGPGLRITPIGSAGSNRRLALASALFGVITAASLWLLWH